MTKPITLDDLPKIYQILGWDRPYGEAHYNQPTDAINGRFLTEAQASNYIALQEALRISREALEFVRTHIVCGHITTTDEDECLDLSKEALAKIDDVLTGSAKPCKTPTQEPDNNDTSCKKSG